MFDRFDDNPQVNNGCYPTYKKPKEDSWYGKPSPRLEGNTIYWYYGNVFSIDFEVTGQIYLDSEFTDIDNFLANKTVKFYLTNSRNEEVLSKTYDNLTNNIVTFSINPEESDHLKRGTYNIRMDIIGEDPDTLITTVLGGSSYQVVVE